MMDLKGFWMRVNTQAPPAPPKQLSSTTSDSIDARGECGGAEFFLRVARAFEVELRCSSTVPDHNQQESPQDRAERSQEAAVQAQHDTFAGVCLRRWCEQILWNLDHRRR